MKLRFKSSLPHTRAGLVIPWIVNGSLPDDAEPALRRHIASCPQCQEELEEQRRVRDAMRTDGPLVFAAESSYQKLLARMQSPQAERATRARTLGLPAQRAARSIRQSPPAVRWLAAAVVLQAFAIGVGAWAWHSATAVGGARYVTLTSASRDYDSGPRARVVFKSTLSLGALRTLLGSVGAHIIDGPANGDVYTLGFAPPPDSPAALGRRIAALRANSAVLLAEPIQDGVR